MKKLLMLTTSIALLAGAQGTYAGGLFGDGGLIRGDVGGFFDKHVEKKVTTPLAKGAERTVKDAAKITEEIVKGAVAVSGLKTVEDVLIEGKSLETSLDEVLDDAKNMVRAAVATPALLNHSINTGIEITGNTLGNSAQDVAGIIFLPVTFAVNLPGALTETVIATTENVDNAEEVVGVPLQAALKQVSQYYQGKGKPLPESLVRLLTPTFGEERLKAVRYVVDDSTGNLAGLINSLETQFGSAKGVNHAVTVENLIVFDQEPSPGIADLFFWAHEIQHTVQYKQMGLDGFAAKYVSDYKGLEEDANNVALRAVKDVKAFLESFNG